MAQPPRLITKRIEDSRDAGHMEHTVGACFQCGHDIWLSPRSLEHLRRMPETRTYCDRCEPLNSWDNVKLMPGQAELIQKNLADMN